ncbi:helix-turn-helix domain-containing protein [uncultured Cellulomonas sp.]|uniref:AraC family transcriptional regulator n=1 Tax=uncultured Cellulomonas sp. TaxID=189682 RepID=UPI0028E366A2|nr:helix-turn-helix domain-containing protein [uncultured Cellulomonas sp.]
MAVPAGRPIRSDEPSGVLHPGNLARYAARWLEPDPAVHDVVDQFWHVRWRMDDGEVVDQAIVDLPAITLSIETGSVPAALVVTGVHRRAWHRRIEGSGDVFAIRLRPAGLAVLSSLRPHDLADATLPLTARLDSRLHDLMVRIAQERTPQARARAASGLVVDLMRRHPAPSTHLLANRVLDELRSGAHQRTGTTLARHFDVSERTIQRALSATLGIGPKQAARRLRLQEAARAIAVHGDDELAAVAVQLGYTDQAHLTSDFRTATGTTPGTYRRTLRRLTESS